MYGRRSSVLGTLVAAMVALGAALPAQAANTAYVIAERHAAAGRLSLYTGEAGDAGRSFEAAFAALPDPSYLFEAGAAYERAKDFASAARVYSRASELELSDSQKARARRGLDEARAQLRATRGKVTLLVFPATATVTVDGQPVTTEPNGTNTWLTAGEHTITVSAAGFEDATRTVTVATGQSADLRVDLVPEAGAALLEVQANVEGASVLLDGRSVGTTPLPPMSLEGKDTVEVRVMKAGYEPWARVVTVRQGEPVRLTAELVTVAAPRVEQGPVAVEPGPTYEEPSSGGSTLITLGWVSTGVGIAALGTGVAFHMLAVGSQNDANSLGNTPPEDFQVPDGVDQTKEEFYYNQIYVPEYNALVDDASSSQNLAIILDIAGGAVTATGVVLLVLGYTADDAPSTGEADTSPTFQLTGVGTSPVPGGAVFNAGFQF